VNASFSGPIVGFTGHQGLSRETMELVSDEINTALSQAGTNPIGLTSLAGGGDQLFAEALLRIGARLRVVIPCRDHDKSFGSEFDLANYRRLVALAEASEVLPFEEPSEEAYYAAGQRIVDQADELIAVWDGKPAKGFGGTADIVAYAHTLDKPLTIIWPPGAQRA
jgi:hypothetical protein